MWILLQPATRRRQRARAEDVSDVRGGVEPAARHERTAAAVLDFVPRVVSARASDARRVSWVSTND